MAQTRKVSFLFTSDPALSHEPISSLAANSTRLVSLVAAARSHTVILVEKRRLIVRMYRYFFTPLLLSALALAKPQTPADTSALAGLPACAV